MSSGYNRLGRPLTTIFSLTDFSAETQKASLNVLSKIRSPAHESSHTSYGTQSGSYSPSSGNSSSNQGSNNSTQRSSRGIGTPA
jgi:hypothetical protein